MNWAGKRSDENQNYSETSYFSTKLAMVKTNKKFQVSETIQGNRPSQKWIAVTGLSVDANLSLSQRKSEREV